ncbi:MAG TPA: hypothetical protein DCG04_02705, partial [Rhodospirillaceae bacterium]|nr:hypothetical protein [Rhodospirillaceae bacterium]
MADKADEKLGVAIARAFTRINRPQEEGKQQCCAPEAFQEIIACFAKGPQGRLTGNENLCAV